MQRQQERIGRSSSGNGGASSARWAFFGGLFCLTVALLGLGGVNQRDRYLTRGIEPISNTPLIDQTAYPAEVGLNVSLEQYDPAELSQTLAEIDALGITQLKQSFYFGDEPDWASADLIFEALEAYPALELAVLLDGDPSTGFSPPSIDDYTTWAETFAERYGDQITRYIIWDEPNIASHWGNQPINPDRYGAVFTAAAERIRAIDPDAEIGLAPLAPTTETGPQNLSDVLFLQALYENGTAAQADLVGVKPYGFGDSPLDRDTDHDLLNFNRAILLREVMRQYGDQDKPLIAGNWGWNALSNEWIGDESIWGEISTEQQWAYIDDGAARARAEWPWMGTMYLHHWQPIGADDDPVQGFAIAPQPERARLAEINPDRSIAAPGYHFATDQNRFTDWQGDWEFSPTFGADMSEKADGETLDRVTIEFWGTDAALRVRRANYRARLYVTIDGEPANLLPPDETTGRPGSLGSALVLNTNDPDVDLIQVIPVASRLEPGPHTMTIHGFRGWDQFALNGFVFGYQPPHRIGVWRSVFGLLAVLSVAVTAWGGMHAGWDLPRLTERMRRLRTGQQIALTFLAGILVSISGFSIWGIDGGSIYRRLGDVAQIGVIAGTAVVFYITPWMIGYLLALLVLVWLLIARPAWGLALVAFTFPFAVSEVTKPIYFYRFSPTELFVLVTFFAAVVRFAFDRSRTYASGEVILQFNRTDRSVFAFLGVATLSLFFTERLDVALSDYRVMIIEPALFYAAYRLIGPTRFERQVVIDGFIASGVAIALIGLAQYATGINLITSEGGLMRLRATYGSPNNVALYLGRIGPILFAAILFLPEQVGWIPKFWANRRSLIYSLLFGLLLIAYALTFSKGGLFIGLPIGLFTVFALWLYRHGRAIWPWLVGGITAGAIGYFALLQVPILAGRLDLTSATTVFRVNLWGSSWQMWLDQPWFGVGLDNFLYEYRGKYILARAWQEPNLNHPHNIILDLLTRLGIFGLIAGGWLLIQPVLSLRRSIRADLGRAEWALTAGLLGAMAHTFAHGMVDHAFFLVDLSFAFYLILALSDEKSRQLPESVA